ncbi:hypothetical protein [Streptomyces lydicus]|uniref:hypothetical protein n=1 Tax=Streptomyces lydicus TaxID=47763 RepID=UPI00101156EE|nr:hypothetical protein [Streptomyces lydicus]MCZ1009798.1 hypothetical protein [Streptomyces lydicus]
MHFKRTALLASSAAALAGIVACGASAVAAPPAVAAAPTTQAMATSGGAGKHHVKYSDEDIVGLLIFAKGKAAHDHPALAKQIRARRTKGADKVTAAQIAEFTKILQRIDSAFHEKVTVPVQINDPFQAKQGMLRLNDDVKKYIAQQKAASTTDTARANGWWWHDVNGLIEINVVGAINAIGYANVAGATEAVVALVVVPAAVSYGFDMSEPNSLDADAMVSAVARDL